MRQKKHVELNIWKACNNRCIFCMSWKAVPEMMKLAELDYLKKRLESYAKEWYNSVWYLGGDISIHPKIIDIISYSKELGFKNINIITNGMLFSKYEFAEKIILAWATRVNFSIHSHIDEVEDYITKIPWWLKRKLEAIKNFQLLQKKWLFRSNLSMNLVLNKLNMVHVVETCIFYNKIWINDIRINFIWLADSWWLIDEWEKLSISYKEFLPYLKKLIYVSLKYNTRITFDTVPPCIFYEIDNNNGDKLVKKFLWEQYDIIDQIEHVNIDDEAEKFKWKDKRMNILKIKRKDCVNCKYYYTCEWVWKEYESIYWLEEIKPIN